MKHIDTEPVTEYVKVPSRFDGNGWKFQKINPINGDYIGQRDL